VGSRTTLPAATDDTGLGYEVGTVWTNTTTGQVFICVDNTAENASWRGQEGDDVNYAPAWQARTHGYETGGGNAPGHSDEMSRWAVDSPYSASDIGTLPAAMYSLGPAVNGTTCYLAAGRITPVTRRDEVATFPAAASAGTISDIGDVNVSVAYAGSGWSPTRGYLLSGNAAPGVIDNIQDYALSSPFSSSDVCEHAHSKEWSTSHDDESYIFTAGGSPDTNNITRFQKGTTTDSTDVGEATYSGYGSCGNTDNTNGYGFVSGGGAPEVDTISRFAFASPAPASDVGEHASPFVAYGALRGVSTTTHGFTVSRTTSPTNEVKERFAFGSPTSGTDVGEVGHAPDDICCHGV
jgi:hypothetical protein